MTDILIQNATIVDGTNAPRYVGDVAIEGGHIAAVGTLGDVGAKRVIDATGQVVVPGFIDMHSHADLSLLTAPDAESLVHQGITTVVTGQCGVSPAPLSQAHRQATLRTLGMFLAPEVAMPWDEIHSFRSFIDYLGRTGTALNVIPLVGYGMIRAAVMGYRPNSPTAAQNARMQALIHEALDCGAFGMSTGLIYAPGSFTSTAELIQAVMPVGKRGRLYYSHIRGEGDTLLEAVQEAIEIGRKTRAPVQISHFKASGRRNWHKASAALALIDQARAEGLDVTADMYPYIGGATYLAVLLPKWALEGGTPELLKRLERQADRSHIIQAMQTGHDSAITGIAWDKVLISGASNRAYVGQRISDLADQAGKDPYTWALDALLETAGNMQMIIFEMSEDNVQMQLQHPAIMFGTDSLGIPPKGPLTQGMMHPRFFGSYPRIFGQYAREEGLLSLEQASWKASGFPAQKLRLTDRGVIKAGHKADLVIFDPATIQDQATYEDPQHYPVGIAYVLINGKVVIEEGKQTYARPGRIIQP